MAAGTQTGAGGTGAGADPTLVNASDDAAPGTRALGASLEVIVPEPPDEALPAGTMVGEFHIIRKLPKGAMGAVYEAVHPVIGKQAAVKVIARRLSSDATSVARFVQEARSVNQIGHVNIVDIFAFGELGDGRPYYVMEWLQGESLYDRLARGALDLQEALEILDPIADALEAAHEKGVVHRDLKPDNVFLVEVRHNRRVVKLFDFGIAKLRGSHASAPEPTQTGMIMGTPGYISPEQARGKSVDHRTDIYALGCMAFQMVTGRLPFPAESAMDMIALHLTQAPPRPSEQRPELSPALDQLIYKMMAKNVDDRPTLEHVRGVIAELFEQIGVASKSTTGDPRKAAFKPKLITPPVGVFVSLPGADPQGPEALMATAAPGELASGDALPVPSSGHMRVHRAGGGGLSARFSDPSLPVPAQVVSAQSDAAMTPVRHGRGRGRRAFLVAGGVALGALAVALAASTRHPAPASSAKPGAKPPPASISAVAAVVPLGAAPARPAGPAAPIVPAAPRPGALIVQVEPANARVVLDGKTLTVIDGLVRVEIAPATPHIVLVEAPGHQAMQFDAEIGEGETMKVPVRLPRGSGKGKLAGLPSGTRLAPALPPDAAVAAPVDVPPAASPPDAAPQPPSPQKPKQDKNYTIDPF
jgi:tRNA A-37 threonylcarbamoyl transferase component Bud32